MPALLDDDSDSEADFFLTPPDKYSLQTKHLYTVVDFAIGGKSPDHFITCELSKNHLTKDVIKHLMTQLRKNKEMAEAVAFKAPLTEPEAFQLRYAEDESDSDEEDGNRPYQPDMDMPPLADN